VKRRRAFARKQGADAKKKMREEGRIQGEDIKRVIKRKIRVWEKNCGRRKKAISEPRGRPWQSTGCRKSKISEAESVTKRAMTEKGRYLT